MILKKNYNLNSAKPLREFYEKSQTYKNILEALSIDFYATYIKILRRCTSCKDIIIDGGSGYAKAFSSFPAKRKIICIDWSVNFLKKAKQRYKYGIYIAADLCKMPLKENSVNFLALFDVLEHLYDVERFFDEVKRILRKGGKVLIISPNLDSPFMPLLKFYYCKKYGYRIWDGEPVSLLNLVAESVNQVIIYIKAFFSKSFKINYKEFRGGIKYTDDDAIFYSSYFIINYLKNRGFKIFRKMSAPLSAPKYFFAKIFPSMFTSIYLIAQKK